jgi:hypothetical protein
LLVARFAVGDAGFGQDREAAQLVRRCNECAALATDMKLISRSVAKLPAAPRTRDFRLTAEQAAQLRGSRLDRWLRTITGSGWATVRPVAAVALSIGMVMSVVGALPILGAAVPGPVEFAVGRPTPEQTSDTRGTSGDLVASPATASNAPTPGGPAAEPGRAEVAGSPPPAAVNIDNAYVPSPAAEDQSGQSSDLMKALPGSGSSLRDTLLLVGLVVTVLALAVLALLYAARRRFYDPLLR